MTKEYKERLLKMLNKLQSTDAWLTTSPRELVEKMEEMEEPSVTPQGVCDLMNELIVLDKDCIEELTKARVQCNDKLADHESVQVRLDMAKQKTFVGIVGILNGLFREPQGVLCVQYTDDVDQKLIGFRPLEKE